MPPTGSREGEAGRMMREVPISSPPARSCQRGASRTDTPPRRCAHRLLEQAPVFRLRESPAALRRFQLDTEALKVPSSPGPPPGSGPVLAAHGGQQAFGGAPVRSPAAPRPGGEAFVCRSDPPSPIGHDRRPGWSSTNTTSKPSSRSCLAGLGAGLIEFAGLADHDRPLKPAQDATQSDRRGWMGEGPKRGTLASHAPPIGVLLALRWRPISQYLQDSKNRCRRFMSELQRLKGFPPRRCRAGWFVEAGRLCRSCLDSQSKRFCRDEVEIQVDLDQWDQAGPRSPQNLLLLAPSGPGGRTERCPVTLGVARPGDRPGRCGSGDSGCSTACC